MAYLRAAVHVTTACQPAEARRVCCKDERVVNVSPWVLSHGSCQLDLCHRYKSGGAPHTLLACYTAAAQGPQCHWSWLVVLLLGVGRRTVDAAPRASAAAFLDSTLLATIPSLASLHTPGRWRARVPAPCECDTHNRSTLGCSLALHLHAGVAAGAAACGLRASTGEIIFINFGSDVIVKKALSVSRFYTKRPPHCMPTTLDIW